MCIENENVVDLVEESFENQEYFEWIEEFNSLANQDQRFSMCDIDYSVVDQMFDENVCVRESLNEYWNRIS